MSAWYVLSSMGIYSVTPGQIKWSTVEPYFENIKINTDKGLKILNKKTPKSYFKFLDTKYEKYATTNDFDIAYAVKEEELIKDIVPVPVIEAESKSFKDSLEIDIKHPNVGGYWYRILTNSNDDIPFKQLKREKITINETSKVEAKFASFNGEMLEMSNTISATFYKKPNNYTIEIKSTYNPQYHAGGNDGLLDGINGTTNWRKGDWQGYQSQDFEAVVDLQNAKELSNFSATFLQDQRSWILMPTKVEYYSSSDNVNFTLITTIANDIDPKKDENTIKDFNFTSSKPINTRYIKVKAYNLGKLPEWHLGFPFDGDAFIFIDEITIK
jgi:hypothetical protein